MRRGILGLAPALLLLGSPLAIAAQEIEPDRLNGTFFFADDKEGSNNTLEFLIDGDQASATGRVAANVGLDVAQLTYTTIFPTDLSASGRNASIAQRMQVLIELDVFPAEGSELTPYSGFAAPNDCQAKARVRGSNSPNQSDAQLKCDLGSNLSRFDDDENPETPGDPPEDVLDFLEQAFASRKDVNLKIGGGKLVIKHKGSPAVE